MTYYPGINAQYMYTIYIHHLFIYFHTFIET